MKPTHRSRKRSRLAPILPLSALALCLAAGTAFAQTPPASAPSPLPIRRVTLFTSGVAAIERSGDVAGDAAVPLTFRTTQINDILKSLTLMDSKGQVQPVIYGAKDPLSRTLQSFAVDVTQPRSRAELLNGLRGADVSVTTPRGVQTGRIVSVETKAITTPTGSTTLDKLNLLTPDGLVTTNLEDVSLIHLRDASLNTEFQDALTTLAGGADEQRRSVTLHFAGAGRRPVQVGYVVEAPLWKISYRLVLTDPAKSYLQGWALVENTGDEDWSGVTLSLVSGRPISFIQDLYQPLYLPRPVVQPDIIASPEPQTHDESLTDNGPGAPPPPMVMSAPSPMADTPLIAEARSSRMTKGPAGRATLRAPEGAVIGADTQTFSLSGSVTAQARGADTGELFSYNVTTPVTLPRQQAAMIPVIAQDVSTENVSLYNADSDAKFPLNAVRLKNNTTLHLKGGPVTLFDGDTYAGDARMEDVPPGDSRLISYAVDLSILGSRENLDADQPRVALAIKNGVLTVTLRERSETKYTFKSKAQAAKTVLVEHPYDPQAKLVQPAAYAERSGNLYRFAVPVPAGKVAALTVVTEKPLLTTVALLDDDMSDFAAYADASHSDIPEATRTALARIVNARRHIADLSTQAAVAEGQVAAIGREQDRIRKNMTALDRTSPLYKRYVGELDTQETKIATLRAQALALRAQAVEARKALRIQLDGLTIE